MVLLFGKIEKCYTNFNINKKVSTYLIKKNRIIDTESLLVK